MITFNNTKTLLELVKNIGKEFENNVFLRYERDDTIFEKVMELFPWTQCL